MKKVAVGALLATQLATFSSCFRPLTDRERIDALVVCAKADSEMASNVQQKILVSEQLGKCNEKKAKDSLEKIVDSLEGKIEEKKSEKEPIESNLRHGRPTTFALWATAAAWLVLIGAALTAFFSKND